MGFFDSPAEAISSSIQNALGFGEGSGKKFDIKKALKEPYNIDERVLSNWYKALPYGFKLTPRSTPNKPMFFYLPINPNNITITTHWGTTVIPTLYGTVEEHSEQRYYDITISGTTGFAPKYVYPEQGVPELEIGRKSYKDDKSLLGIDPNAAGGFFQNTIGAINQTLNTANSMLENFTGVEVNSGIDPTKSGYIAFHNFYRALLSYKKDAAGIENNKRYKRHPLTFLNYKDNQQYDCAVLKFDLKRNADDPMLYNYTIILRAYNLVTLTGSAIDEPLENRLFQLGLDGVEGSAFQKFKQTANGAKGLTGALKGGLSVFGG